MTAFLAQLRAFLARLRVILTAAPTWLVAAAAIVTILSEEISTLLPSGWQDDAARITATVLAVLGAAVAIIRRVTPVLSNERGILPADAVRRLTRRPPMMMLAVLLVAVPSFMPRLGCASSTDCPLNTRPACERVGAATVCNCVGLSGSLPPRG